MIIKTTRKISVVFLVIAAFVLLTMMTSVTAPAVVLECTCGDLCVNETGWWRAGDAFNENLSAPIQAAVDNATAGETICVQDGNYNENVNVNKRLTIRSQNGSANCLVTANDTNDHVFNVTANYVNITGFTVTGATGNLKAGICLDTVNNCTISNNTASGNFHGIFLRYSSSNNLTDNTANSNTACGIFLYYSSYNAISNSTALSNWWGIRLEVSNNNNLTGNNASYNNYGISLFSSNCNNNLIGNTANSNSWDGIRLSTSSNYNNLTGNNASYNGDRGIYLYLSSNNNLTGNNASYNGDYGIYLEAFNNNNLIYNNYFNNTNNAYDTGNNIWNITKTPGKNIIGGPYLGGNYWSDYAGTDTDDDCLGNTQLPYNSSGDIQNGGDWHPLVPVSAGIPCTCGDICVNEAGWWGKGGWFNASGTPIQAAVDNATENETICVHNGTYHENVVVNVDNLTIRSENGPENCIVIAKQNEHIFKVTADYVNISGFTVQNATGPGIAGIYLDTVRHCNISNNNALTNSGYGIYLYSSSKNTISCNNASNNNDDGIYLYSSNKNTISCNNVSNNKDDGIYLLSSSNNNTLMSNTASNNRDGLVLDSSSNNTIANNTLVRNGIKIWGGQLKYWNTHSINLSNTVNGKPVYYWKDRVDGTVPLGAGQVILANCTNVMVENQNVSDGSVGIILGFSNNNTIANNTANLNNNYGILLWCSDGNNLTNNTANANNDYGIYLRQSCNSHLMRNDANLNNKSGIYLRFGCSFNTLTDNTANLNSNTHDGNGIFLEDSCNNNDITGNNATSNKENGILLVNSCNFNNIIGNNATSNKENGIRLYNLCKNNNITGNNATSNKKNGICLYNLCNNSNITNNNAISNKGYGIALEESCNNNTLTQNHASYNVNFGILLVNSCNNTLADNTANSNDRGIELTLSAASSYPPSSDNNLTGNNASSNDEFGISLISADNNTLTDNIASNNFYGIFLLSSSNNRIYNNYFNNTNNAQDDGKNTWNITKTAGTNIIGGPFLGGNYWNDYAGTDTDMPPDGLGDTLLPYNSSGKIQKGGDWHPLNSLFCDCGDICVNETGWWRDGGVFNVNLSTPIQAAVDNATAGETICVQDGNYTENVVVNVDNLLIRSENGPENCIATANDSNDHVFNVTADYVNISGFTVTGAIDSWKAGIYLCSVTNCTISNNTASNNYYGIYLISSSNNNLASNNASNNTEADFYSTEDSEGNTITDLTICSYPTTISFTYDNGIVIKGVDTAPADPGGKLNVSTYVNITNVTTGSWIDLQVSYNDSALGAESEESLTLWRYNGTGWSEVPNSSVDTDANQVLANISSFSIFAPLGDSPSCICGDICVNETGWWRSFGAFNENLSAPIQAAVDNATAGETICVHNGTYTENVDVNKSLTIQSQYGADYTTVQAANASDHVFNVTANYVNITGFTVQNATGGDMAGIWLNGVEHCTILDNTATNNYCGIYLTFSPNNTLINNTATLDNYYGIWLYFSGYNNLTDSTASNNTNSGIYLLGSHHNNLTGNTANSNGGDGINLYNSDYNNLTGNTANSNYNAGIYLFFLDNNNLTGNTAVSNGFYGICLSDSQANTLLDNFVADHKSYRGDSFDVLLLKGATWTYQDELSFRNYETLELPLTHNAGALTLRLSQHGHDGAYVDYVALKQGENLYEPATAVNLDRNADICYKLVAPDYDVCDAWNSTLELTWNSVPADTTLVLRAMEEDLGPGHGSPIYYPLLREGRTLSHTLVNDGGITVDGVLNESKAPSFSVFWRPDSPHPDGYTYGWLHADDQYVYAAVEVTADNTADEEDWGALFIMVNGELREFRIAPAETTWGQIGFQYTSAVPYEHRIYEFAIPLDLLNARIGDELHYGFGAYGTVAYFYAGIFLYSSDNNNLSGNRVTDNENGIYLYNAFENNITCNAIYKNMFGLFLGSGSVNNTIEQNGIVANMIEDPEEEEEVINFINEQDPGVNATNNYWGTTVAAEIAASIEEWDGEVSYEPFLYEWPSCAPGVPLLDATKTVWNGTAWVKEVPDAYLNDTVRFNCTITNIGGVNITDIRFWDILDCSLVFAGNATLTNATGVIINDSLVLESTDTYTFKPKVLHPHNLSWNPYKPSLGDGFTELCPDTGHLRALWGWKDTNNDGRISACDQINLSGYGLFSSYHVERVPYTLNVTNNETGESVYLESGQVDQVSGAFKARGYINYEAVDLTNPNYTYWLEAGWAEACCGRNWYQIDAWNDTDGDGNVSVNDTIQLWNQGIDDEENLPWYTITELAIDLVVSREWDINDFVYPDVLLEPGQSLTLEYNATDIDCGEDTNTFVAKGLYEGNWTYSNKDFAVVEVPPRPAVETTLTVWNGTAWAKAVTVMVNDTLNFSWMVHNNGSCCELFLDEGALTVASKTKVKNINIRLAPCSEVNGTLKLPALECGTYTVWWNVTAKHFNWVTETLMARDTVTVTVLCPELEVNKTVWNGTAWAKELDASINDTVRFNCTITNTGNANLTQLRFWDILDCSLVYAGNATLTNASGVKKGISTPPCLPSYCFKPKVLHSDEWWDPRGDPTGLNFTELCPQNNSRQIKNWYDTDHDDTVSVCDQVQLSSAAPYPWYHVDRMPYTLNLSNANGTKYFESVFNWDDDPGLNFSEPVNSTWLEVCYSKDQYKLIGWNDIVTPGELTAGDNVTMQNQRTMDEVEYTVAEGIATDLVVSLEWELDNILHEIVTVEPYETITIEYNATVVKCGVDNNTFVAKGNYSGIWYYSDPDIVTITVPCPFADATDSSGAPWEIYHIAETVYATGCGFKPNSTVNIYITEDKLWLYGMDINSTIYRLAENVSTNASGCVLGYPLWLNPDPGTYDLIIDANQDGKYNAGDGLDGFEGPGFMVLERALSQVPALTPPGMALLIGLLSVIATSTLVRRKRR